MPYLLKWQSVEQTNTWRASGITIDNEKGIFNIVASRFDLLNEYIKKANASMSALIDELTLQEKNSKIKV
jgi:hypothetical protein